MLGRRAMHVSVIVVYDRARFAHEAQRILRRSAVGAKADTISVYHRRLLDGRLAVASTSARATVMRWAVVAAAIGGLLALFAFASGDAPVLDPWAALVTGTILGGSGVVLGASRGLREPVPCLEADAMLATGRAAVVAEFADRGRAAVAERFLLRLHGAIEGP